jgi:hypothetical protein
MHRSATRCHFSGEISRTWRWLSGALAAATLAAGVLLGPAPARAETSAPDVKLYVFDLGWLKARDPKVLTNRGVSVTGMSVVAYLIVHPRGTLLWDSGTMNKSPASYD